MEPTDDAHISWFISVNSMSRLVHVEKFSAKFFKFGDYNPCYFSLSLNIRVPLRLVFISDGVVVEVVIRSVERCDLVKIKPTESEAEHCIRL